jgi:5-methylcytosine-specific restriction endonuclease McrA
MVLTKQHRYPRLSPYPKSWTPGLKEKIRARDQFACQECGVVEDGRAHHVHHIDYDKHNMSETNLITLCASCHAKTTNPQDRVVWIRHYQAMMAERERREAA